MCTSVAKATPSEELRECAEVKGERKIMQHRLGTLKCKAFLAKFPDVKRLK